jgi:hypothetical protein
MRRGSGVALAASSSSTSAPVDQAPVLVLVPPGRPILPNRMSPSCLGEPRLKGSPASSCDLVLQPRHAAARTRRTGATGSAGRWMPRRSMRASTGDQRALQRLVDGGHALGGEPRLQRLHRRSVTSASSAAYSIGAFVDGEVVDRHLQRHVLVERHQRLRQPRLLGVLDQRLAPLRLLDLAGAASSVSRSPYSPISCAAVLTPMPGTPGTLSTESPAAPARRSPSPAARRTSRSPRRGRCACPSSCRT